MFAPLRAPLAVLAAKSCSPAVNGMGSNALRMSFGVHCVRSCLGWLFAKGIREWVSFVRHERIVFLPLLFLLVLRVFVCWSFLAAV